MLLVAAAATDKSYADARVALMMVTKMNGCDRNFKVALLFWVVIVACHCTQVEVTRNT